MEEDWTSINIKPKTKEKLDLNTTKNMTYDEKISSLLDFWIRYKDVVERER
jgi:hypothetical protein